MNRAAELFSNEAMGYSDPVPQLGGWSLNGYRVTDSLLPGMKEDLARMSGGARVTQRGGNAPGAPMKMNPTESRVAGLSNMDKMLLPQNGRNMFNNVGTVQPVTNVGPINWREYPMGAPMTPKKGLGSGLGNAGMLPGEQKPVPGAPKKLQFGGGRKSRKGGRKTRKGHRTAKSFLNIRVTGRIRMKQRHRQ